MVITDSTVAVGNQDISHLNISTALRETSLENARNSYDLLNSLAIEVIESSETLPNNREILKSESKDNT